MLSILISGSTKTYAIENFYVKYLNELGVNTFHFGGHTIFQDFYEKNIFNKIAFKSGFSSIYTKINNEFRNAVNYFKPDVICVFKGMELFPETLMWVKQKGIFLVNYNPDNPYLFTGKGSGNNNILNGITLFDLYLTYDNDIKKELIEKYKVKSDILSFGFELSAELHHSLSTNVEIKSACFIGNPDNYRADFINCFASPDLPIDVYGHGWNKFINNKSVRLKDAVYNNLFWMNIYRYRVQLNLMRIHNPHSHNMRTFEIPAASGIMLAPDTSDHRFFFVPDKEIFLYKNLDSCISQTKKILGMTAEESSMIRSAARDRCVNSGYSYKDRAFQFLSLIKSHRYE